MEVKPFRLGSLLAGYQQTEVGVIPEDWDVKLLREISDKIMVGIASAATHAYRDRGVVLFRNQNIKPGYLDDGDILHVSVEYEAAFKGKRLKAGDLLTARTGYPGTTCVVPEKYEAAQSFTTLITRPNKQAVNSRFLCAFINSERGQSFFTQNQIGGGQKNVNIEEKLLTAHLTRRGYAPAHIAGAIHQLRTAATHHGRSLYGNNQAVYQLLRYGVSVKTDAGRPAETVHLIDWSHPEKNDFAIAEEVTLSGRS